MDLLVNSYDKLMGEIERRVNRDFDIELKQLRSKAKDSTQKAISTLKIIKRLQRQCGCKFGRVF